MEASSHSGLTVEERQSKFKQLLAMVEQNVKHPHRFPIFHKCIRTPFDYYRFGLDFIGSMIDFKRSAIRGLDKVKGIASQLAKKENVILLANHQTEPDPQIIKLLLEPHYPDIAKDLISVAGHRVVEDPVAIPLSMGCNLLCIYSKKHINHPPEDKPKKILHNQKTMKKLSELLKEGGKCIYVAPSGGRDRTDKDGHTEVAQFDPQSLEMFWLMSQQAEHATHFYPTALLTHDLMPPPQHVEKELGEKRIASYSPVYMAVGSEVDMEQFPGSSQLDKKEKRSHRAQYIWNLVRHEYSELQHMKNKGSKGP